MIELILMQRVDKLGQMGELVKVKPGYARNFLLPQGKAIRASKDNLARFERDRAQLEAQNLKRREEAERVAERVFGLSVVIIRAAGESGGLYGSVTSRDIADACKVNGLTVDRAQVLLEQPIKTTGITQVRVELHPEVVIPIGVNVARSQEEADKQARGEDLHAAQQSEDESLEAELAAELARRPPRETRKADGPSPVHPPFLFWPPPAPRPPRVLDPEAGADTTRRHARRPRVPPCSRH
jgi:large subunit ribosomal protein L9